MPQIKHNKKRNAGLLYEWLVAHVSDLIAFGDDRESADACIEMVVRYFDRKTALGQELHAVRSLAERRYDSQDRYLAAQAISEFKSEIKAINLHQSNIEKSNLIKEINLMIDNRLYDKEVKDYRLNASICGLLEAIKREDSGEQARFETLVLNNLTEAPEVPESSEFDNLTEEEAAIIQTAKFSQVMGEKLRDKIDTLEMTERQQRVIENWDSWQRDVVDDEGYREFLNENLQSVFEFITKLENKPDASESNVTLRTVRELKELYTKKATENFSNDALTEHVLEGLGIERFFDES